MLVLVPTEKEAEFFEGVGELKVVGMGPVVSALNALSLFERLKPKVCVLAGIAGAYEKSVSKGDVVIATEEVFGDFAVCGDFLQHFSRDLPVINRVSLMSPYLEKACSVLEDRGISLRTGTFVTVCCSSRDPNRAKLLRKRYEALAENMEGFGVALAAKLSGVSLIEVRGISNLVGEPKSGWEPEKALKAVSEVLRCLVRMSW